MAGKKVQVPVRGGLFKVVNIPTAAEAGTTITEFGSASITLAQLKTALGITNQKSTTASGALNASLVLGPGLSGGGVLAGAVALGLLQPTAPIVWTEALLPDDWIGSGGSGGGGTGGSSTLAGLTDVAISSPSLGQVLAYNGTKWANASVPGTTRIVNKGANWVSSTAIVAGSANIVYVNCPMAGTIQGVRVVTSGGPGSCVIDVWKAAFGSFPPLVANSITASAKPTISAGVTYQDLVLTGWTTAITAGDILAFFLVSASTFTQIEITLQVAQ